MLEVLYDTQTLEVRAWNADEHAQGNYEPGQGEAVVLLPVDPPNYDSDQFYVDLTTQTIWGEPIPPDLDYLRACELLETSPPAITMPDIWELLRILAKRLGIP